MSHPKMAIDKIAKILAELDYCSYEVVSQRWNVSKRTIARYKKELENNEDLANKVNEYRAQISERWADTVTEGIVASAYSLKVRSTTAKTREDAECIKAIAEGLRALGEIKLGYMVFEEKEDDPEPGVSQ